MPACRKSQFINLKHGVLTISGFIFMIAGFIAGIILFLGMSLSLIKNLGPDPNSLIAIFVVLPLVIATGALLGVIMMTLCLYAWKPFLTRKEVFLYFLSSIDLECGCWLCRLSKWYFASVYSGKV